MYAGLPMPGVSSAETQVRSFVRMSSSVLKATPLPWLTQLKICLTGLRHRGPNQPIWIRFFWFGLV